MPELPEVEASRLMIEKHCLNKRLTKIDIKEAGGHIRTNEIDNLVLDESLINSFELFAGRNLTETSRKGKYMLLTFGANDEDKNQKHILFHFGLTGYFKVEGEQNTIRYRGDGDEGGSSKKENEDEEMDEEPKISLFPPKFTKIRFYFDDGTTVAFVDIRRIARARVVEPSSDEVLSSLALDPLFEMPTEDEFIRQIGNVGKRAIKTILLDQSALFCGIGNYLADEILLEAGIHPTVRASELTSEEITKLQEAILKVCKIAVDAVYNNKEYPKHWLFHRRWDTKKQLRESPRENIEEIKVGGRITLYNVLKQIPRELSEEEKEKIENRNSKRKKLTEEKEEKKKPSKKSSKNVTIASEDEKEKTPKKRSRSRKNEAKSKKDLEIEEPVEKKNKNVKARTSKKKTSA